jgi:glycosyltransferase involved in cell wall biosynthesis
VSATVSVVIPTFGHARFLPACLDSVLAQTHRPAEIVVVDDGSTDDTPAVLERYRGQVAVLRQANRGVSAARNAGAARATGDVLAFLDADDVWLPRKLEAQLTLLGSQPELGLVHCGVEEMDGEGRPLSVRLDGQAGRVAEEMMLFRRSVILGGGSAAVVPRPRFEEVEGFDERLSTSADWDLHHRLARRHPVGFVPEVLVRYRVHAGNMHADVSRTAREMLAAYARAFAEDAALAPIRDRAYGGLHAMLSGSFHAQGRYGRSLDHGLRALWHDPTRLSRLLGFPARRWRRRRGGS